MEIKRTMLLKLDVLASTTIKRKKPWPKLAWLGKVIFKTALHYSKDLFGFFFFFLSNSRATYAYRQFLSLLRFCRFVAFRLKENLEFKIHACMRVKLKGYRFHQHVVSQR